MKGSIKSMKKLGKFIFGTLSLAAIAGGAFYFLKNMANKSATDDFDDFEDDYESFDTEEDDKKDSDSKDSREYVTININSNDADLADAKPDDQLDGAATSDEATTSDASKK